MNSGEPAHTIRTVLVGGHESNDGADLLRISDDVDGSVTASPGRAFHNTVSAALEAGETVVVVPMTFGRNPTMVADTAKTLKWLAAKYPQRIAMAASFGQLDHLTAWLRAAANRATATDPAAAMLVVAARSNPFDEAELHRIAYLAATHSVLTETGVAIADSEVDLAVSIDRLHRLGAEHVVVIPAGFAASLPPSSAEYIGPLMSDAAILRVVRTRIRDAIEALQAGHDGIDDGLMADHGHGYAHSHAFDQSQSADGHGADAAHGHPHTHSHGHAHSHTHTHSHT
jgi:hypothetical protein